MVLNTLSVGAAVTPTVTKTWVSHYVNRKPLRKKPTAHISYDLGLHLVRRFVQYSALHTVEELQAFTGQWVPAPRWVKTDDIEIDVGNVNKAAEYIQAQLGPDGIEQVGGKEWWQWRRDNQPLKGEWIEMRADYNERKAGKERGNRVMLYVHGGAYYFGSVNEHRYQIQRHARKLKARCLAPRYRLAPQFPFPCGLHDCLAAYLYLLGRHDPSEIIVAGDSAGGGMVLSMLVVLRDQGLPLPAGAILLSPWVDLTHSFPSICASSDLDYIPGDGFIHKPSMGWPPPTLEDVKEVIQAPERTESDDTGDTLKEANSDIGKEDEAKVSAGDRERGYSILQPGEATNGVPVDATPGKNDPINAKTHLPAVMVDGKLVQIRDQIQLYAPNHLLYHPLVSPVLQPSLGGLPPILVQVGGGELLRDEQLYVAHKMANPEKYAPRKDILDRYDPERVMVNKYKPTNVQVQLWEDICHVGHTLSFTRPAKFMYRSVAQFGAWALAHAQHREIDIPDDDSSDTDSVSTGEEEERRKTTKDAATTNGTVPTINVKGPASGTVGRAGDPLPKFINHMIRQRVDRHGDISELEPVEEISALNIDPEEIGILKEGPVKKWLVRQEKWNKRFASTKRDLQRKRAKQLAKGYVGLAEGEKPPPTALAGMRTKDMPKVRKITTSWGMMMWSGWGSKHDEMRVQQEKQDSENKAKEAAEEETQDGVAGSRSGSRKPTLRVPRATTSRSRSRSRSVMDEGQANGKALSGKGTRSGASTPNSNINIEAVPAGATVIGNTIIPASDTTSTRPTAGGIAYPFKLKLPDDDVKSTNASMMTLDSEQWPTSPAPSARAKTRLDEAVAADAPAASSSVTPSATATTETPAPVPERPQPERFETARETL